MFNRLNDAEEIKPVYLFKYGDDKMKRSGGLSDKQAHLRCCTCCIIFAFFITGPHGLISD